MQVKDCALKPRPTFRPPMFPAETVLFWPSYASHETPYNNCFGKVERYSNNYIGIPPVYAHVDGVLLHFFNAYIAEEIRAGVEESRASDEES